MNPKILLVDDDPDVLVTYAEILGDHGFEVSEARTRDQAIAALDTGGPWDVVVLDEKLHGPGGAATATDLLGEIASRAPEARTIVITGFATPQLVRTAVAAGAWDYLQKEAEYLHVLLPLRVRHAVEAARERRLRKATPAQIEQELRRTWAAALTETDSHKKGRLLEETLFLLFRTIPGLDDARLNRRSSAEEFDLVVTNGSTDPVLAKEGSFFLVECKNWSSPVDPKEVGYLRDKLRDRFQRARLGIFVAVAGFTRGVDERLARQSNEPLLVLPLVAADITAWIDASDRVTWLRERVVSGALRS